MTTEHYDTILPLCDSRISILEATTMNDIFQDQNLFDESIIERERQEFENDESRGYLGNDRSFPEITRYENIRGGENE
jgi:hypothetical protein